MKPIRVFWSPTTKRFYASRAWKQTDKGFTITGHKSDVTNDIGHAISEYGIAFIKPQSLSQ